jgi:hypothetical protein
VPALKGLSSKQLLTAYEAVNKDIASYLPDPASDDTQTGSGLPQEFLFNLVRSLDPDWLDSFVTAAVAKQNPKASKVIDRTVKVPEETYHALMTTGLRSRKPVAELAEGRKGGLARMIGQKEGLKSKRRAKDPPHEEPLEELKKIKATNNDLKAKYEDLLAEHSKLKALVEERSNAAMPSEVVNTAAKRAPSGQKHSEWSFRSKKKTSTTRGSEPKK